MASSAQAEALECDSYASDVPPGETKDDGTSGVSMETEALECNQYVGPVDTVESVHSGIMVDSAVDSAEMKILESAGKSEKAIPGDVEAAGSSDIMASGDNDGSEGVGVMPVNTEVIVEKREAFECDPCAVVFADPVDVEAAASEQDGPMMASTRAEGFDYVSTVDDFRVSTEQGILTLSPKAPEIEEEATSPSLENVEAHVIVPDSSPHVKQEVTLTAIFVSDQEETFGVAHASGKTEGGKVVDSTFHDLEENQGAEHAYDIDFGIDAHDMRAFLDEDCLFPVLDADKTASWHAGVDDVIMVDASAQAGSTKHHGNVDMNTFRGETNNEPVAMHDVKESDVVSKEEWISDTQQQPGSGTLLADSRHGVEESSVLSNRHAQGHEELASYRCNKTEVETLASGVAQDKELACVDSKDADAPEIPLQYDTEDIFESLAGANVETVQDADTSKTKRLEEEVNTKVIAEENKIINMTHDDGAVHLYELDQDVLGGSSVMDVEHVKAGDAIEDSRLEGVTGHKEIVTQFEVQGKGPSLDFEKKDECTGMQLNEANAVNQLIVENNDLPVDSSMTPCTNSPAFMRKNNTEPDCVPIVNNEQGESVSVIVCRETCMEVVSEAPFTNSPASILNRNMEPEYLPTISKQGESVSVIMSRETSMEVVSESLAQEEASTLEQNAVHDKFAEDNNESHVAHGVLSHLEAVALHVEPVQNQSSELVVVDVKYMKEFDDDVLLERNNDVKENYESGVETAKVRKVAEQKASSKVHEQSDQKSVDDFDGSVPEPSKSELEETHVSGDEIKVVKVVEHEKRVWKEEQKQSDGGSADDFDGSVQEMEKNDVEEGLGSGDGVTEGEVAVAEQEKEAANEEVEEHSLTPLAGTSPPQAESVEELSPTEATIHLLSSSDHGTNVNSGTDFTQKVGVSDGLKDSEESAPLEQRAALLEQSGEVRGVSVDAPSKKKSEKGNNDDKLLKAEQNKFIVKKAKEAVGRKYVGDHANAKCQPELENESIGKKPEKPVKQGFAFGIGDLIWAKVRSHPWWPAQIFDPADASKPARKAKKSGRVLVAFFGDCTFAWLQQSQMIAFRPSFKEKVQQTTMRIFCLAVEEALEELCRRSELGLSCKHFEGALHSTSSFPDANTGIREGVRGESLKNIRASAEMFRPKKTLEFVKNVAASPFGAWSSTLQWAELRGHAYGLRTCMVAMQGSDSAPVLPTPPAIPSQGLKLKRSYSSRDPEGLPGAENGGKDSKKAKKLKFDKERKEGQGSLAKAGKNKRVAPDNDAGVKLGVKNLTESREEKKDRNVIKIKLSKKMKSDHFSSSERRLDTASGEDVGGERVLEDSNVTLLAMASHSVKPLKRSSSKEEKAPSTLKKVQKQIGEESKNDSSTHRAGKASLGEGVLDMDDDVLLRTGADTDDAFDVVPSPSRDGGKKTEVSKMLVEVGLKKEVLVKDKNAEKIESARKLSKVGDSIRRVANELTGTPNAKVVDDVRRTEPNVKKKMQEAALERDASPVDIKAIFKEASEDISLLQLRRDLELVAKKAGKSKRSSFKKFSP